MIAMLAQEIDQFKQSGKHHQVRQEVSLRRPSDDDPRIVATITVSSSESICDIGAFENLFTDVPDATIQ
jgi:hypothetical protein